MTTATVNRTAKAIVTGKGRALSLAFSLWLTDMNMLPVSYTSTSEFRQVYREHYLRFSHCLRVSIVRGGNANPSSVINKLQTHAHPTFSLIQPQGSSMNMHELEHELEEVTCQ